MGFNLEEVAQRQDRLLSNIAEQNRKSYEMFYSPTPADVTLPQYDENGQLVNVQIPNRAKIKKEMWDDVGAAIGQFSKILWVDAVNGLDTNPGTELSPFKTLNKALNSVPVGGNATIKLLNDLDLADPNQPSAFFSGKKIVIDVNGNTLKKTSNSNKVIISDNFPGYLKIFDNSSSAASVSIVNDSVEDMIRVVDNTSTVVIGDYDNRISVQIDNPLVWIARSPITFYTRNVDYAKITGASTNNQVIVGETMNTSNIWYDDCTFDKLKLNQVVLERYYTTRNEQLTLYVDAANGDDGNFGHDENHPLKTFAQAVTNIPQVGYHKIIIIGDVTHTTQVWTRGKSFSVVSHQSTPDAVLTLEHNGVYTPITVDNRSIVSINVNMSCVNPIDTTIRPSIIVNKNGSFTIGRNITKTDISGAVVNSTLSIADNAAICYIVNEGTLILSECDISTSSNCRLIDLSITSTSNICINKQLVTLNGATITDQDVEDNTINVIKDANGVPRNVTSNIIF